MRDATASPIFASAAFCAALNSNSNGDWRGLSFDVVKSSGSSTSSINPRRTSVPSVVRGTSRPRRASTGKRPPEAASVSINVRWFSLSFVWGRATRSSSGGEACARSSAPRSTATFTSRAASRAADTSSRPIHFFRTIPASSALPARVAPRKFPSRTSSRSARKSSTRNSTNCCSGVRFDRAGDPDIPAKCSAIRPASVMRYATERLNSAESGSMVRNTSPTGAR